MGVSEDWNPVLSLQEERGDLGDELGLLELGSPFEGSWLSGQIREKRGRLGKHGTKTPLFGGCNGILKGWLLGLKFQAFYLKAGLDCKWQIQAYKKPKLVNLSLQMICKN